MLNKFYNMEEKMTNKHKPKRNLVSDRVNKIPRSAIHEMTRLSMQVKDPVSLSWARPAAGSPEHINEGACQAIKAGLVSGYSASIGVPELREAIVEKLKRDNNIKADPSEVMVTVGAIEGLSAAVMALLDPGDEVLIPSPNYSTHAQQVLLASAVPVYVPTIEEDGFSLDIDAFRMAVNEKTKAIMFCTPSNPTGAVFEEEELKALGKIALENDLAIIVDESYEYFTFDGVKHFSLASFPELKERTVSCFTFTKTYAMTGWRVGYVLAKAEWVTQMLKAHIPFTICAPVVSQYAALAALQGPQDCVAEFRKKYLDLRDLTCERLDRLSSVFEYQKPKGSYCMFPKILHKDGYDSLSFCKKLLLEGKVSTTPGVAFGPTGEGHLRITFCDSREAINKAFDRMEEYFGQA
jgi:aminotransferase